MATKRLQNHHSRKEAKFVFEGPITVRLADPEDVRRIKKTLAEHGAMLELLLEAVVNNPEKLAEVTARIRESTAKKQAAIDAHS